MKIRLALAFILIGILCSGLVAQSVVITGKKITYTRKKPISDYKRTFTINYPKVKAATPSLSKRVETAISYQTVFSYFKLKEEIGQSSWIDSADYDVLYNKNGVLCVALSIEGSGAYPQGSTKYAIVNVKIGVKVKSSDLFLNLKGLRKLVEKEKEKEVSRALIEARKDSENAELSEGVEMSFRESAKYNPILLDQLSVSDKGVTFHHDYEFAHVIEALQPPGEFKFTWKQLKPYIKPGGLLGQFVR